MLFLLGGVLLLNLTGCSRPAPAPVAGEKPRMQDTPFVVPGVRCPPVHPAADANLADEEEVAGVVVAGKPRAYQLKAMKHMFRHVVNDLVAEVPVTVTYCDQDQCVCVFTDDSRGAPLDISSGGYRNGFLLKVGGSFFEQESGRSQSSDAKLPYRRLEHERTTWKAWKAAHPDTEVYTGPP